MSSLQGGVEAGIHESQDYGLVVQPKGTPSWRLVRTYLQSGQTSPVLSTTSQSQLIFEIPSQVVNLSKSWLRFDTTLTTDAAIANFEAADRLPFQEVKLYTRSGVYLMNINANAGQWSRAIRKLKTPMDKFLASDPNPQTGGEDNATGNTARECLCRSNNLATADASLYGGLTPAQGAQPAIHYTEPRYVISTAQGTNIVRTFEINLGACFPETILSMPQDMWFGGNVMLLEFDMAPSNQWAWAATVRTDPVGGAAANSVGAPAVTNMWLNLAYQDNKDIAADVIKKFSAGMTMYIPFTQLFKYPTQAGTSFSQPLNLNAGYGRTIQAIRVIFANTTENFALGQDTSNLAGSKVNSFQSMLDSQLLQPYLVDCQTRFDDYELIKPQIVGCPLGQSRYTYQLNWLWSDDFSGKPPAGQEKGAKPSDNIIGGVLLTQENKVYTFTATTANAAYNVYYMVLFTKKLTIHAGGNIECS